MTVVHNLRIRLLNLQLEITTERSLNISSLKKSVVCRVMGTFFAHRLCSRELANASGSHVAVFLLQLDYANNILLQTEHIVYYMPNETFEALKCNIARDRLHSAYIASPFSRLHRSNGSKLLVARV